MALLVAMAPWWALVVPGGCWLLMALRSSWGLLVPGGSWQPLVTHDGMAKKASISKLEGNKAGESIPLMFGVLPRDNV